MVDVVPTMALSVYHASCIRRVIDMLINQKLKGTDEAQLQLIHQKLPVRSAMMTIDLRLVSRKCLHLSADTSFAMAALVKT